jgi:D-alanyl-D-alanine carboxypeptidase
MNKRDACPMTLPFRALLAALLLSLCALPVQAQRYGAIVLDAGTGEVLHAEEADAPTYPASLTKMMTLYLTFEAIQAGRLKTGRKLRVSSLAAAQSPTKLGLVAGRQISVEHAILGLVTRSANDASVVLAEAIGGSVGGFARRMNAKAKALGMTATAFRNPNGLPDPLQVTTARDMARLARALVRDFPGHYHYFSRRSFTMGGRTFFTHNHLMDRYKGMDGLKTGYIRASGFNLASSAVRGGRRLVAVVMGGPSPGWRDDRMAELLDLGFSRLGPPRTAPSKEKARIAQEAALPAAAAASVGIRPARRPEPPRGKP